MSILLISCSQQHEFVSGKGGRFYGGSIHFKSNEKIRSFFPLSSNDIYSERIVGQIFEPLLTLDPTTLRLEPCLASSYEISDNARTFRFKIRKGVYFHEDECFENGKRTVNAQDVKFSLEFACSGLSLNKCSYLLISKIEGAEKFYNESKNKLPSKGIDGITVLDENTLEIKLTQPFIGFDNILTMFCLGIFPPEAYRYYGQDIIHHPIGTGPFRLESKDEEGINLSKNHDYWRKDDYGNRLPFLDEIHVSYAKDKKSELLSFRNNETDLVFDIPVEEVENVMGSLSDALTGKNIKHRVESLQSYNMTYLAFNCSSEEFRDPRIRVAFSKAIDRASIVTDWLKGEGFPAENGFIPEINSYNQSENLQQILDVSLAKNLLTQAGYPDGKGFPTIEMYVNATKGTAPYKMCQGIAQQLKKNLGVNIRIKSCTLQERNAAIQSGKAKIWRTGWIADYPDAESFLSILYSGNSGIKNNRPNLYRFENQQFDEMYRQAIKESDVNKRNEWYRKCNELITELSPIIPIYSKDYMVMFNSKVRGIQLNSMERLDLSTVFIRTKSR